MASGMGAMATLGALGISVYQQERAASEQRKALREQARVQEQQVAMARAEQRRAQAEERRKNQKQPNVGSLLTDAQKEGRQGAASTLLTGLARRKDRPTLGGSTLLG